jgi:hypothetical protein
MPIPVHGRGWHGGRKEQLAPESYGNPRAEVKLRKQHTVLELQIYQALPSVYDHHFAASFFPLHGKAKVLQPNAVQYK